MLLQRACKSKFGIELFFQSNQTFCMRTKITGQWAVFTHVIILVGMAVKKWG